MKRLAVLIALLVLAAPASAQEGVDDATGQLNETVEDGRNATNGILDGLSGIAEGIGDAAEATGDGIAKGAGAVGKGLAGLVRFAGTAVLATVTIVAQTGAATSQAFADAISGLGAGAGFVGAAGFTAVPTAGANGITLATHMSWLQRFTLERGMAADPIDGGLVALARFEWLVGIRSSLNLLGAGSQLLVYWSLKALPLALFSVIAFTSPLFLILFSWLLLGEKIGPRRALAVALGFLGVVLAYLPGIQGVEASALNLAALAALAASFTYALVLITINRMEEEGTGTLGFYNTLGHVVLLWPVIFLDWQPVESADWFWLAGLGILTGSGWVMTVHAYRIAAASLLASYEYLYLVWAGLFGFLFFDELLGLAFWLSALLIVGSGLYLARREHIETAAMHHVGELRAGRKRKKDRQDGGGS